MKLQQGNLTGGMTSTQTHALSTSTVRKSYCNALWVIGRLAMQQ